jgi:hypothetical protein
MAYKRISPQPVVEGGTGAQTFTAHGVLVGEGTSAVAVTAAGTTGQVLTGSTGADPVWASPAASSISITGDSGGALTGNAFTFTGGTTGLTFAGAGSTETVGGTLAIANGGTNATSMATTDGVVYYDGTRLVTTAAGTATNVLTSNGAGVAPTFQAVAAGTGNSMILPSGNVSFSTSTVNTCSLTSGNGLVSISPLAGTFSNLYFNCTSNASTTNVTITLIKNGSATSLVATITALTTGVFSDTTHSVSVSAGDLLNYSLSQGATGVAAGYFSVKFSA